MADEVLDILTRISFEANDQELERVNAALRGQVGLVRTLEERLKQIDAERRREGQSVQQIRNLSGEYDRVNTALRNLNTGYRQQSGLIGRLQEQQQRLTQQLTNAASRQEIQRINAALGDTARQLQDLNGIGRAGGGSGPFAGLANSFKTGLGFAGGFGLVSVIGQGISAVKDFAKESFQAAASFEQLTTSFNTLLNSRQKASQLLQDLQAFAQATPFGFTELTQLSKQLLAFGFSANEIIPTLQTLGDVAGGVGADKLPQIVYAFGQIRANGRLTGQDLLQLVNAGFNPLQVISEKTGKSIGTLRKEMEKGRITFKDVEGAFKTATSEGGKFFNLMQAQSKTTSGAISNLGDAVDQLKIQIGSGTTGPIKSFVLAMGDLVNSTKEFISLDPAQALREEQIAVQNIVGAITDENTGREAKADLMKQLRTLYPDFLGNLKDEEVTTRLLGIRLRDVNDQYDKRIKLLNASQVATAAQNLNQGNAQAQSSAAIARAGIRSNGITNPDLSKITTADIAKLSKNQKEGILFTLQQAGYDIGLLDANSIFTSALNYDIAALIRKVDESNAKAVASQKVVNAGLADALKAQAKARDEANPLNILEEQNRRDKADIAIQQQTLQKFLANPGNKTLDQINAAKYRTQFYVNDLQKAIDIRQAEIDKMNKESAGPKVDPAAPDKSVNTLVDELKKKLLDLTAEEAKFAERGDVITSESIKRRINAATEAAIQETNIREEAAIRDGKQTKASADLFNQIRGQIRKNGDLQYTAENKAFLEKLEKDQAAFNLSMRKLELQLANDRLKIRTDDLALQKQNIEEAGRIQEDELNLQYDQLRKQASDLAKSAGKDETEAVGRVEADRQAALQGARQRTNQALLDADISFFDRQTKELERTLEIQLLISEEANAQKLDEAKRAYDAGEISYRQYRSRINEVNKVGAVNANLRTQAELQEKLNVAIDKYNQLIAERDRQLREGRKETDPVVTAAQVGDAEKDILLIQKQIRENADALRARNKADRDARIDRTTDRISETNSAIQDIGSIAAAFIDAEQRKTDALIAQQQRRVEKAKEAAERGNGAVLKAEEDRLEKLEAKQRSYAATQLAINRALAISQQVLNAAQAVGAVLKAAEGDPYTLAVRVIAAAAAVAGAIFTTVNAVSNANDVTSGFYKGGYTGDGNEREEAGAVHKREFVFDHKATQRIGKDNLEALRYGRLELVPAISGRIPSIDYAGMRKEAGTVRQAQFEAMFNTQRLERKLDKLDAVIEAIDGIPLPQFNLDSRGFSKYVDGHIKHMEKMKKL